MHLKEKFTLMSFKLVNYTHFYEKRDLREANLATILKNGRHLGFLNVQSDRFHQWALENNQTKFHARIIICTIFLLFAPLSYYCVGRLHYPFPA